MWDVIPIFKFMHSPFLITHIIHKPTTYYSMRALEKVLFSIHFLLTMGRSNAWHLHGELTSWKYDKTISTALK